MAIASRRPGRHGRQISKHGQSTPSGRPSDAATEEYTRRILCSRTPDLSATAPSSHNPVDSQQSLAQLLPPLTSSNDVDIQLYALIAVVLDIFVQSWYNRLTPDQQFVQEVVQIIAHSTRGLEQRLRKLDLERLLLDELPGLLTAHVNAVDIARSNSAASCHQDATRTIYHTLRPHNALTPVPITPKSAAEQLENENTWCQMLVDRVLPLVLPSEDLTNPTLHVLVAEVLAELILSKGVCGKVSEAWLLWEGVTRIVYLTRPDLKPEEHVDPPQIHRLEQYGLLAREDLSADTSGRKSHMLAVDSLRRGFWTALQIFSLVWLLLRTSVVALVQAPGLPARTSHVRRKHADTASLANSWLKEKKVFDEPLDPTSHHLDTSEPPPIFAFSIWECIPTLTRLDLRMPWLTGMLSLTQWLLLHGPGKVGGTNSRLDRLLSHTIATKLLDPALLPAALSALRAALFPNNAMAPARIPPTQKEILAIKHECARVTVECIPDFVRRKFFGSEDVEAMRREVVESMLSVWEDEYVNKGLLISVIELLLLRLFPEIGDS